MDKTHVDGDAEGLCGRGAEKKSIVVIAAEGKHDGIGRIRLRRVPNASGRSLLAFIGDVVEPGADG